MTSLWATAGGHKESDLSFTFELIEQGVCGIVQPEAGPPASHCDFSLPRLGATSGEGL